MLSQTSKDVMDATKAAASTMRPPAADDSRNKGHIFKESIEETYKGVPNSLESDSLLSKTSF